jgi:hypothetical protein
MGLSSKKSTGDGKMKKQDDISLLMSKGVKLICDELTNQELICLNFVAQEDWDPRGRDWYEKAKGLFTASKNNHPCMHNETKNSLKKLSLIDYLVDSYFNNINKKGRFIRIAPFCVVAIIAVNSFHSHFGSMINPEHPIPFLPAG